MKPVGANYIAILQSRAYYQVDCYQFSGGNLGGTALRYTSGDQDITLNGKLFSCGGATGPYFDRQDERAKVQLKAGMEVDSLVLDIIPGSSQIFGAPFLSALLAGILDGAEFMLYRVVMPLGSYGDTRAGANPLFGGRVAEIDFGRSMASIKINSHLELLDIQIPRNLYQPGCVYNLYDTGCGVNPASFQVSGTVAAGSTNSSIFCVHLGSFITGYFDLGKIQFTSGALNGLVSTVKVLSFNSPNDEFQIVGFLPSAPAPGDTFNIFAGCDKTTGTNGCTKFNNLARYRGFPFVPLPSTGV